MDIPVSIVVLLFFVTVKGQFCGICDPKSGAVCYNATHFALCDENLNPTWNEGVCPPGLTCASDERICVNTDITLPCRSPCGYCTNPRFACKSNTTYSLCFGADVPNEMEFRCPYGKICSTAKHLEIQNTDYCFDLETLRPHQVDCNDIVFPAIPTPPPTINPTEVCRSLSKLGFHANKADRFNKTYYRCQYKYGKIVGSLEICPLHRTFDKNRGICA